MEIVKDFFARKTFGFYFGAVCALLSLVCSIVYIVGFPSGVKIVEYTSNWVFICTLLAFIGFCALSLFKETSGLAAPFVGVMTFVALIIFAIAGFDYFPETFFGSFTFEAFFGMEFAYWFCLLTLLLLLILNSIAIYFGQEKKQNSSEVAL